jgi:hypothetical protein
MNQVTVERSRGLKLLVFRWLVMPVLKDRAYLKSNNENTIKKLFAPRLDFGYRV